MCKLNITQRMDFNPWLVSTSGNGVTVKGTIRETYGREGQTA